MKKNILLLQKKYFVFREEAKNIRDIARNKIKKEKIKTLYLDFVKTSFFSRSFVDELLNITDDFKNKKIIIKIVNLKPQLENFLQTVDKRKKEIKKSSKR